jgi:hypothetical protein
MVKHPVHQPQQRNRASVAVLAFTIAGAVLVSSAASAASVPMGSTSAGAVSTEAAAPPPLSGTVSLYGHTITYSTTGVSAVPAGHPEWAGYAGVVPVGGKVTLSGSIDYVAAGGLTYLTMWASLNGQGGPMPPEKEVSKKVAATTGTYTLPFSFSEPVTASSEAVAAGMSSRNCNDSMVCGGPEVLMYVKVVPKGTALPKPSTPTKPAKPKPVPAKPTADTTPPKVRAIGSGAIVRDGQAVPARFTVSDDSRKAVFHAVLYSGGTVVPNPDSEFVSPGLKPADGRVWKASWPASTGGTGPFFFCVWAVDAAGNASEGAPKSSCAWIARQVTIPSVSNGCGTSEYGESVASVLNWLGDIQDYGNTSLNIRLLCNQHDAAYAGVTVGSTTTHKIVDYRKTTRLQADDDFLFSIRALCKKELKKEPALLAQCQSDAAKYYGLVRSLGKGAYDADATTPGVQVDMPASTNPAGGARNNA